MIIGKLYMDTTSSNRSILSDDDGKLGKRIGTLQLNDIVLFLGELNKEYCSTKWLKILTSDGVVGYVMNYDCNDWKLVEDA
jgi:hypothetical protein